MNYNETTMTRKNIFVQKIKFMIIYYKRYMIKHLS